MPYSYVSVDLLKSTGALDLEGTAYDVRLRQLNEAVTTQIDRVANRRFQVEVGTKFYSGDGAGVLMVKDLVEIPTGGLLEDNNMDATFNVTWDVKDFVLGPYNADPTGSGRPYTRIEVSPYTDGTQSVFSRGRRNFSINGTWGYSISTADTGHISTLNIDTTQTTILTTATVGTVIGIGDTIRINSEMMYVENKDAAGTSLTVARAQNGSTAGSHGSATATITRYSYPAPITEAAFIHAARLWTRKDSSFANTVGFPDGGGVIQTRPGMDADVKGLLVSFRKIAMGGAV